MNEDPKLVERARALRAEGYELKEVQRQTGLSERAVKRICKGVVPAYTTRRRKRSNFSAKFHVEDYEL